MPPASTKRKRTVFLVDDHELVREWLRNLITQQPDLAVCGEAKSAPGAREKIIGAKPDVAVVDISMKGPSGIELIQQLKQRCPEIAVLVLSMHEAPVHVRHALRAGADGYVMKRESATKTIEAIRRILDGGVYVTEETEQTPAGRNFRLTADSPTRARVMRESVSAPSGTLGVDCTP